MMKKQDLVHSFVLLVILIAAVSGLFFFSKFTGFVTYVGTNGTFDSTEFSEGTFENAEVNDDSFVILNSSTAGVYISKIFGNGEDATWNTFDSVVDLPVGSNALFSYRVCDDALCDTETFNPVSQSLGIEGNYFQYKVEMSAVDTTEQNSPKIQEVTIDYTVLAVATSCGDGAIQVPNNAGANEVCDNGANNGQTCTALYADSCAYCSADCLTLITVQGAYCGDQSCNGGETCATCDDCACSSGYNCNSGVCEEETTESSEENEESSEEESDVQVSVTAAAESEAQIPVCIPSWQCDEWGTCENSQRTRACIDSNACGTTEGIPATSEACLPAETCTDGIQNQNEEGIDCGGSCETSCRKSFFSIVGSAITGPIDTGKKFFQKEVLGNKTRSFIVLGVIVAFIAGFVLVKKFLAVKISLKKGGKF